MLSEAEQDEPQETDGLRTKQESLPNVPGGKGRNHTGEIRLGDLVEAGFEVGHDSDTL
jgi:hypothetical protein